MLRFLHQIHERERAAVPEIQAQLEAAPSGEYRDALARHLAETRDHIPLLDDRLRSLGYDAGALGGLISLVQAGVARATARRLTPLDLLRPHDARDRVLERARHMSAVQASNIADFHTLERLAEAAQDAETQALAGRLGEQEQETFNRIMKKLPALSEALAR